MSEEFKIEIVNPERSFLSKDDITEVIVPAFEGEMGILKDHIPLITFLRPGFIEIEKNSNENIKFFIEEGTVEFLDNKMLVLTTSAKNLKNFDNSEISEMKKELNKAKASREVLEAKEDISNPEAKSEEVDELGAAILNILKSSH